MAETLTSWAVAGYDFLLPWAWLAALASVVVCGPLAAIRATRPYGLVGMVLLSYVIGATAWFMGASITLMTLGLFWTFIGVLFFGVGVVPLGLIGSAFIMDSWAIAFYLLGMVVVALGLRVVPMAIGEATDW